MIVDLVSDQPTSAHGLAANAINSVDRQLLEWANSANVHLGEPGSVKKGTIDMGGFMTTVVSKVDADALPTDLIAWEVGTTSDAITLRYDKGAYRDGGNAFAALSDRAEKIYAQAFEEWTFLRYLWESVCKKNESALANIVKQLALTFTGMSSGLADISSKADTIETRLYVICNRREREGHEGGHKFIELLQQEMKGRAINFIEDESARNEISFVRMDAGIDERNVDKLGQCQKVYLEQIQKQSPILPLSHIFAEEEGMVAREIAMYGRKGFAEQGLIHSALAPLFAHEKLAQIFIALNRLGLIFIPYEETHLPRQYLCYFNASGISQLLSDPAKLPEFVGKLAQSDRKDEMSQVWGDLFALNPKYIAPSQGDIPQRPATDHPDLFTAMARFVQRLPNAIPGVGRHRDFPLTMEQANLLWDALRKFWEKPMEGDTRYQQLLMHDVTDLRTLQETLDQIKTEDWETPEAGTMVINEFHQQADFHLHGSPLTKVEASAFLRQLSLFTDTYARAVEPPTRVQSPVFGRRKIGTPVH